MRGKAFVALAALVAGQSVVHAQPPSISELSQQELCKNADSIYYNATFITMNDKKPKAEAVAVTNQRITAVGDKASLMKDCKGETTKLVDFKGATVTPGFIDTHSHFTPYGVLSYPESTLNAGSMNDYMRPDWKPLRTTQEIVDHFKAFLTNNPNYKGVLKGYGYDETRTKGPMLSNKILDEISTSLPILVVHSSGHKAFGNTAMVNLLKAKFKQDGLKVCAPDDKHETCIDLNPIFLKTLEQGIIQEDVFATALVLLSKGQSFNAAAKRSADIYANRGYTTVNEGLGLPGLLKAYDEVTRDKFFPVDVVYNAFNLNQRQMAQVLYNDNKRLYLGPVKFFADGSPQSFTAYMEKPYYKEPKGKPKNWRGVPAMPPEQFKKQIIDTYKAGYQVAIHNIGNAGTDLAMQAIEEAQKQSDRKDSRTLFIHSYFATPEKLKKMRDMDINVTFTIPHVYYWGQIMCNEVVGPELAKNYNPVGWGAKYLKHFAFHSDAPVTMPDPFFEMAVATTRKVQQWNYEFTKQCPEVLGEEQKISIMDGLKAITTHAAHMWFLEKDKGSLEVGKIADMTVLDKNPLDMQKHPEKLREIKVLATVHRGTMRKATNQEMYRP